MKQVINEWEDVKNKLTSIDRKEILKLFLNALNEPNAGTLDELKDFFEKYSNVSEIKRESKIGGQGIPSAVEFLGRLFFWNNNYKQLSNKICYSTIQGFDGLFLKHDISEPELFVYESKSVINLDLGNEVDQNFKIKAGEDDLKSNPSRVKRGEIESIRSRIITRDSLASMNLSDSQISKISSQSDAILDGKPNNAIISASHTTISSSNHTNAFAKQQNICFKLSYDDFANIYKILLEKIC